MSLPWPRFCTTPHPHPPPRTTFDIQKSIMNHHLLYLKVFFPNEFDLVHQSFLEIHLCTWNFHVCINAVCGTLFYYPFISGSREYLQLQSQHRNAIAWGVYEGSCIKRPLSLVSQPDFTCMGCTTHASADSKSEVLWQLKNHCPLLYNVYCILILGPHLTFYNIYQLYIDLRLFVACSITNHS